MVDGEIDRRAVLLDEPLRELGLFEVKLRLHPEVEAQVEVQVYAMGTDPDAVEEEDEEDEDGDGGEAAGEQPAAEAAADDAG